MAKVSAIQKNLKRQKLVEKLEQKRSILKSKIYDKSLSLEERFQLVIKLAKLSPNSSSVRVRNRCEITGRPRAYYRKFKLCRNTLRELASDGFVSGLRKSSW